MWIFKKKIQDIPEGVNYDDILSAFYNFRNSAYGKLEKGSTYTISTIPKKGHKTISVEIKDGFGNYVLTVSAFANPTGPTITATVMATKANEYAALTVPRPASRRASRDSRKMLQAWTVPKAPLSRMQPTSGPRPL